MLTFLLRRTPGSAWMPHTSAFLTRISGCNSNVQYLYNQLQALYVGMYASKSSKDSSDGYKAALAAYTKICDRQDRRDEKNNLMIASGFVPPAADQVTDFCKGLRRMHGAWSSHTGTEQVGAPRAGFFNLGYDGWIASRGTARLAPNAAVAYLMGQPLYNVMTARGSNTPRAMDYVFRPESLEDISWLELVHNYERVVMPKGETDRVSAFDAEHPDYPHFGMAKRRTFVYPQVSGMRMPNRQLLEDYYASVADRILYTKNALILTVPFRNLRDLGLREPRKGHSVGWWAAWYKVRETKVTEYGRRYLDIAQDYYTQVLCNKDRSAGRAG